MTRLTELGKAWRDYLYANHDAMYNEAKDFKTMVDYIDKAKVLAHYADTEQVESCRQGAVYKRKQLEDIIQEFTEYYNISAKEDERAEASEILNEICEDGTSSYLYQIAEDWKVWGEKVERLWGLLNEKHDYSLYFLQDDLCRLMMDEIGL